MKNKHQSMSTSFNQMRFTEVDRQQVFQKIQQEKLESRQEKAPLLKRFLMPMAATFIAVPLFIMLIFPALLSNSGDGTNLLSEQKNGSGSVEKYENLISMIWIVKDQGNRTAFHWLMTYNKDLKKMKLLLIPRDIYVPVVNENGKATKNDRLTNLYSYDSDVQTLMKSVSTIFDLPLDFYVTMGVEKLIEMVDAQGGVQFDFKHNVQMSGIRGEEFKFNHGSNQLSGEDVATLLYYTKEASWEEHEQLILTNEIIQQVFEKMPEMVEFIEKTNLTNDDINAIDIQSTEMIALSRGISVKEIKGVNYSVFDEDFLGNISNEMKSYNER